jgi:homoserine kinase
MNGHKVTLRIPATAANVGPGYSTLSLALEMYNNFSVEEIEGDASSPFITNLGIYGPEIPVSPSNLVYRSACYLFKKVNYQSGKLKIVSTCNIPEKRGLASSATAVVAGLIAGNVIARAGLDRSEICQIAEELGESPDVISCILLGGLTMTIPSDLGPILTKMPFPNDVDILLSIPEFEILSRDQSIRMPRQVSLEDALFNTQRMALFIATLFTGESFQFSLALEDKLHLPSLKRVVPAFSELVLLAQRTDTLGTFGISFCGDGPSFMIFHQGKSSEIARQVRVILGKYGIRVRTKKIAVNRGGIDFEWE